MRRKIGIGCLGIVGLVLLVGVFGALLGDSADSPSRTGEVAAVVPTFTDTPSSAEPTLDAVSPMPVEAESKATEAEPAASPTEPTETPIPAPTVQASELPADTPSAAEIGATINVEANLREGPGTEYAVTGAAAAGSSVNLIGQSPAGDWYQLADGNWIAAFLVADAPSGLPVTAVQAQLPGGQPITDQPAGQSWSKNVRGYEFTSDCPCNGDTLNCGDFGLGFDAQACYEKCMDERGTDTHRLDRDKDGSACEWRW